MGRRERERNGKRVFGWDEGEREREMERECLVGMKERKRERNGKRVFGWDEGEKEHRNSLFTYHASSQHHNSILKKIIKASLVSTRLSG